MNAGELDKQDKTENAGISTEWIMEKMGNTWRGVQTSTKAGETDQGVTSPLHLALVQKCHFQHKIFQHKNVVNKARGKRVYFLPFTRNTSKHLAKDGIVAC
jgi:hypothetical protein